MEVIVEVRVPTGGQILGFIVRALQLYGVAGPGFGRLTGKSRQRLFATGRRVRRACTQICLVSWIVGGTRQCTCGRSRKLPELFQPILFRDRPSTMLSRILALAIHAHVKAWDERVRPHADANPELLRAFVRFAALDVAHKAGVLRVREGGGAGHEVPAWCDADRYGEVVAGLLPARPLEKVAADLDVSHDAVKRWRSGSRIPTAENIDQISRLHPVDRRAAVRVALHRHYLLVGIAKRISGVFGPEFVRDLARVFVSVSTSAAASRVVVDARLADHFVAPADALSLAFSSWLHRPASVIATASVHAPAWQADIELAVGYWAAPIPNDGIERIAEFFEWVVQFHGANSARHKRIGGASARG